MISSFVNEPDGIVQSSIQALWIKSKMESSTAKWKIVVLHRPPYNSTGGIYTELRWPFKLWGADAVFAGHKHNYERLIVGGLVYFVNGLGGRSKQPFRTTITGSKFRYNGDYGAMLVEVTSSNISFCFYNTSGTQIDPYVISDPTPVELVFFAGTLNGSNVELHWRTETEFNNYGFDIERTKDKSDWLTIGFVEGHGNSNSPKQYNFIDTDINQSGTYNYRLKQIDNDGTYEYSDVVNVEVGVPNNFYLSQNYPNPFNPETRIDFTLPEKQLVSLRVYNTLGELVGELVNEEREAGSYSVTFDASKLPSGVYIYRFQTSSFAANKKMTLLK
jgi:Secretion system C-terminal sorting domain